MQVIEEVTCIFLSLLKIRIANTDEFKIVKYNNVSN